MATSVDDLEAVRLAFQRLGIPVTLDRARILDAFRTEAKKCHPDVCQSSTEKERAHRSFIGLTAARDVALEAVGDPLLIERLLGSNAPFGKPGSENGEPGGRRKPAPPRSPNTNAYEQEWEAFVMDQHAYFRFTTSAAAALDFLFRAGVLGSGLGAVLIALIMLQLVFFVTLITLFVAAVSSSFAIPLAGWIFGLILLRNVGVWSASLVRGGRRQLDSTADSILRTVAMTGFPSRAFWTAFLVSNAASWCGVLALFSNDMSTLGTVAAVLSVLVAVAMLAVYSFIEERLSRIDAAFNAIRRTRSYQLMLAPPSATPGSD